MQNSKLTSTIDQLIHQGSKGKSGALEEAIVLAKKINDEENRDWYLGKLVHALVQVADWEKAKDLAILINHPLEKADSLLAIAGGLVESELAPSAESVLQEAEHNVSQIAGERFWLWQKADALNRIAALTLKTGHRDHATDLWKQAIEDAQLGQRSDNDPQEVWDSSGVLTEIAENLAFAGEIALANDVANSVRIEDKRKQAVATVDEIQGRLK